MQPFARAAAFAAACACADAFASNGGVPPSPPASCAVKELVLTTFSGGYVKFATNPVNATYIGTVNDNGMPHGFGTLSVVAGKPGQIVNGSSYVGEFVDGLFDGLGTLSFPRYYQQSTKGRWKAGKKHGQTKESMTGIRDCVFRVWEGQFKDNVANGVGRFAVGDVCEHRLEVYAGHLSTNKVNGKTSWVGEIDAETGLRRGFGTISFAFNRSDLALASSALDLDAVHYDDVYEGGWVITNTTAHILFLGPGTLTIAAEQADRGRYVPEAQGATFAGTWFAKRGRFVPYNATTDDMVCVTGTMEKDGAKESGTWCYHTPSGAPYYFTKEEESTFGKAQSEDIKSRKLSGGFSTTPGGSSAFKFASSEIDAAY